MKKISLIIVWAITCNHAFCCDICGCFMGITPYDNQSQIQFLYRYRSFNGYYGYDQNTKLFPKDLTGKYFTTNPIKVKGSLKEQHGGNNSAIPTYLPNQNDFERYQNYELRGKYFLHRRIELNAILSINSNASQIVFSDTLKNKTTGFGDGSYFIGWHILRRTEGYSVQQRLVLNTGIKIPHGNYYSKNKLGERIDLLLQSGTGSVDYFLGMTYIAAYKKVGFSLNSLIKWNGSNYYDEHIGNSFTQYVNFFLRLQIKKIIVMPSLQTYYENTKGLYINNKLVEGTSMNVCLAGPGLDTFYKNWGLHLVIHFRAWEEEHNNKLRSSGRLLVGLSFNFNQRNYLFKSKKMVNEL